MRLTTLITAAVLIFAIAACEEESTTATDERSDSPPVQAVDDQEPEDSSSDSANKPTSEETFCLRQGQAVDNYDINSEGASRSAYLIQLHTLQRDCPKEAQRRGLASDFLPKCKRLDEEDCTYYGKKP